jgi:hypothetical protein
MSKNIPQQAMDAIRRYHEARPTPPPSPELLDLLQDLRQLGLNGTSLDDVAAQIIENQSLAELLAKAWASVTDIGLNLGICRLFIVTNTCHIVVQDLVARIAYWEKTPTDWGLQEVLRALAAGLHKDDLQLATSLLLRSTFGSSRAHLLPKCSMLYGNAIVPTYLSLMADPSVQVFVAREMARLKVAEALPLIQPLVSNRAICSENRQILKRAAASLEKALAKGKANRMGTSKVKDK